MLKETCSFSPTQYEGFYKGNWIYIRYRYGCLSIEIWRKKHFKGKCLWNNEWQIGDSLDGSLSLYYKQKIKKAYKTRKIEKLHFKEYTSEQADNIAYENLKIFSPFLAEKFKKSQKEMRNIERNTRRILNK